MTIPRNREPPAFIGGSRCFVALPLLCCDRLKTLGRLATKKGKRAVSADHVPTPSRPSASPTRNVLEPPGRHPQEALDVMVDALTPHAALIRGELADLLSPKIDSVAARAVQSVARGWTGFFGAGGHRSRH